MKKHTTYNLLLLVLLLLSGSVWAQDERAFPALTDRPLSSLPVHRLPEQDNQALRQREMARRKAGVAPRFAETISWVVSPQEAGQWSTAPNGMAVWRYQLSSPGAYSLNLGFSEFHLPPGAVLILYNPDDDRVYGPFTPADNEDHATLWTPLIPGDRLIIELQAPGPQRHAVRLKLREVNHDFIDLMTASVLSGNCNLDVICGADDGWSIVEPYREVIRSVGLYTLEGNTYCTGFLVNNTRNDCTPYFITAYHCDVTGENASSMVVYWNFENSRCRNPGSPDNGRRGDGKKLLFNTGATFLSGDEASDITLVQLDDPVAPEANAYFAGWNVGPLPATGQVACVHHAGTDEKRISIEDDGVYIGRWGQGNTPFTTGDHLIVADWEVGSTEDGSSGGPLFNTQGQAIGSLHGGTAACGNNGYDAFGWLHAAWSARSNRTPGLQPWLDPDNSGIFQLQGKAAEQCYKRLDVTPVTLQVCPPQTLHFEVSVSETFHIPVTLSFTSSPNRLSGAFSEPILLPGGTSRLTLNIPESYPRGPTYLILTADDGVDRIQTEVFLNIQDPPGTFHGLSPAADTVLHPDSVTFRWSAAPYAQQYRFTLAADPEMEAVLLTQTVTDTFLRDIPLDFNRSYFWQVEAVNTCGASFSAAAMLMTARDLSLTASPSAGLRGCVGEGIHFQLNLGAGFGRPAALTYHSDPPLPVALMFDRDPERLLAGGNVQVFLPGSTELRPGVYRIDFTVAGPEGASAGSVDLRLQDRPPPPRLLFPDDQTLLFASRQLLVWEALPQADSFRLEVSDDPGFHHLFLAATTDQGRWETELPPARYYWRVSSGNACGEAISPPATFFVRKTGDSELNGVIVRIDPNPTDGPLLLTLSEPLQNARLELYHPAGGLLLTRDIPNKTVRMELELSAYPAGAYLIRIVHRFTSLTKRILVH